MLHGQFFYRELFQAKSWAFGKVAGAFSRAWAHRLIIDCYFWPHELLQMFDPFTKCLEFASPRDVSFSSYVWINDPRIHRTFAADPLRFHCFPRGPPVVIPVLQHLNCAQVLKIWRGQSPRWFPSRVVLGCPQFHLDECHHWTTGATYTVYRIPTTDRNNMSEDSLKETQDCSNPKQEEGKTGRVTKPFKCHLITAVLKGICPK